MIKAKSSATKKKTLRSICIQGINTQACTHPWYLKNKGKEYWLQPLSDLLRGETSRTSRGFCTIISHLNICLSHVDTKSKTHYIVKAENL